MMNKTIEEDSVMNIVIYFVMVIQLAFTVYFSFRARRNNDPIVRGLYFAKMNITIGLLFLTLAIVQLFTAPFKNLLVGFAIFVLLIGLYNLFVGLRNHSTFSRLLSDGDSKNN
jgi:ABC-type transport system involved in multi-copper enzyme maturation permease subunit